MKLYLYKGGLHKITSVPRRWDVPRSAIPLGVFRRGVQKRTRALGLVEEGADSQDKVQVSAVEEGNFRKRKRSAKEEADEEPSKHVKVEIIGSEVCEKQVEEQALAEAVKKDANEMSSISGSMDDERTKQSSEEDKAKQRMEEEKTKQRAIEEKARQRAELEEKLKTLTAEKHRYVLILKQILSTEEESKKKNQGSMQSPVGVASSSAGVKSEMPPVVPPPPAPSEMKPPPLHSPQSSKFQSSSFYPPPEPRLTDLEEGELDCARTPSPRSTGNQFSRQTQHGTTSRLAYQSASSSGAGYRSGRIVKWDSDT